MSKRALVTGGAGFIGSHLVDRLIENWLVDVVDDLSNGSVHVVQKHLHNNNLIIGDFACDTVLDKIRSKEYDYVFHLAAQPRVSYSVENPVETNDTNVTKTIKLLDACRGNVKKVIFASSSSVYGNVDTLPTSEEAAKRPESPYALQKLIVEDYLRLFGKLYGLDSVCLRFFNVFGPRQLGDSPYSTAVSAWLTAIMKNTSMRSDGDGSQTRDMVYVNNVVDAMILAAKHEHFLGGQAFNVGSATRVSNLEILDYLKSKFPEAQSHQAPPRAGDVKDTLADLSKIRKVLGYGPSVPFWTGLDRTIAWHLSDWAELVAKISEDKK